VAIAAAVIGPTVIATAPTTFIQITDQVCGYGNQSGVQTAREKIGA
jgi:hypothetical protein